MGSKIPCKHLAGISFMTRTKNLIRSCRILAMSKAKQKQMQTFVSQVCGVI